jgi:hypothetical protein
MGKKLTKEEMEALADELSEWLWMNETYHPQWKTKASELRNLEMKLEIMERRKAWKTKVYCPEVYHVNIFE